MISAVLFDLDGTLLETEELKGLSYARSVTELRPDVAEEDVMSAYADDLVGHSRQEVATDLMRRFQLEEAARGRMDEFGEEEPWRVLVKIRLGVYEALLEDSDLLLEKRYPHNIEMLRELRREGYPTACATMSHRYQVERVLSVLDLEDAFDVVATADDIKRGKPDPEIDLLVAEKMGVPPEEFLVIEDSPAGVRAALAAGMMVVAVPTKLTVRGVRAAGILEPRWVVEDPEMLPRVVRQRIEEAGGRSEGG
ncbi:MAG TPA: HAD family phosphatase [Rubrobacteraceae bacterium]|nr:HAD family phosphatase [Rubrobacteraceae bacterium]